MTVRIFARERLNKSGLIDLVFIVYHNERTIKFKAGEQVRSGAWDQRSQKVKQRSAQAGALVINARLDVKLAELVRIFEQNNYNVSRIREIWSNYLKSGNRKTPEDLQTVSAINFYDLVEKIINDHRHTWSQGHALKLQSLRTKILAHDGAFSPEKFSFTWWTDFVTYCQKKGNSHNTIAVDAKNLKRLIDFCSKEGFPVGADCNRITYRYIEPKIEPLTWEEVALIAKVKKTDVWPESYSDSRFLFLVSCYTGQRWSDLIRISPDKFYFDRSSSLWKYRGFQKKTKQIIEIPLLKEAVNLLKPRGWTIPRRPPQVVNRDIKQIARLAKIPGSITRTTMSQGRIQEETIERWRSIHIHTGRHSYAVEIARRAAGKPYASKFVAEMLGHASSQTSEKYLNLVSQDKDLIFKQFLDVS